VAAIASGVAVPRFEAVRDETSELARAGEALCAMPSAEGVEAAREAWREARSAWMRSAAVWFGPVMDRRSRSLLDWPEVEPERIEAAIAERDAVTSEDVREFFASTQRGLGAAEYLLFGGELEAASATAAALAEPVRCQYLVAVLTVIEEEAVGILEAWTAGTEGRGSYVDRLTGEAAVSLEVGAALDEIGERQALLLRMLAEMQLGAALGATQPEPDPSVLPGGAAGHETVDLLEQVRGIQDAYLGGDEDGLTSLVAERSAEADLRVRGALAEAVAALEGVPEPMRVAAGARSREAVAAYEAVKALQVAWGTDVVSVLGITVGFSDADGDSG
jgi:predicted lipoprotein